VFLIHMFASNAKDNLLVWSGAEYQSGSSCC
jgi:hypothetical protein